MAGKQIPTLTLGLALGLMVASACVAGEDLPTLHIPAIIHSAKPTRALDDAGITLEAIGKCMGMDLRVRTRLLELQRESRALQELSEKVPDLGEQFAAEATTLSQENERLKALSDGIIAKQAELALQKGRIEQSRPSSKGTPNQIKTFNAAVEDFNAQVQRAQMQFDGLQASMTVFRGRVAAFQAKVDASNEQVKFYNERAAAFRLASDEFRTNHGSYLTQCAGERTIIK